MDWVSIFTLYRGFNLINTFSEINMNLYTIYVYTLRLHHMAQDPHHGLPQLLVLGPEHGGAEAVEDAGEQGQIRVRSNWNTEK